MVIIIISVVIINSIIIIIIIIRLTWGVTAAGAGRCRTDEQARRDSGAAAGRGLLSRSHLDSGPL
jgi:hypothetical protein